MNKIVWQEKFEERYKARVVDCRPEGRGDGWWLEVIDTRTDEVFHESRAPQPYSTMSIADAADWYRDATERAVHRYEKWAALPTEDTA